MTEEKIHNVNVVLRYAVTGSESTAEKRLADAFRSMEGFPNRLSGNGYEACFICSDVNPGEVEGYRNYETFSIAVWLNNDRKLYDQCRAAAQAVISNEETTVRVVKGDERTPELVMAGWLEWFVKTKLWIDQREEDASNDAERMFVSLAQAAFDHVDFRELAEEWLDDARKG